MLLAAIALALGAGLLLWRSLRSLRGPEERRPLNIIVVTADTLRADRLPAYGYQKLKTPHLDAMAASGILFENAQTVVPLTLPSHSSIFTGTYPMFHGVRDNGGYYLDESQVTLAETLKEKGYRTGGFVAAFVLDSRWGIGQGFERYFDDFKLNEYERVALDTVQRRGDEVLEEAIRWMDEVKSERFFSWIHFYDAHTPYDPPEPFLSQYDRYRWGRYDGEIAYVDSLMGQLFQWLSANELDESTIVVFMGDHGESLGEHRETAHGFFIYDATMHVPLILKAPYRQLSPGGRIETQVSTIDLMPTLLDLVGIEIPETVQGMSLTALMSRGNSPGDSGEASRFAYGESFYPRNHYGWSDLKSLRNEALHFISAPRPELFDLRSDPRQESNLAEERPGQVQQLQSQLEELVAHFGVEGIDEQGPESLDPDVQAQLAALGYLGGPSKVAIDPDRPLADPKDKIDLFNLIKEAGGDSSEGRVAEAMEKIRQVLEQDDDILEAHNILGNLFTKEGDAQKAIEAYQAALARDPEYKPALFGLALSYQSLGREEDAAAGFRRLIELDPRDNRAYFQLAQIHVDRDDFATALELLRRAVDAGSERAPLHNLMAECLIGLDRLDEAEIEVHRALEMNPDLPTANYNIALIHEERGEVEKAIEAYQRDLESAPRNFKTHFNLGKLYGETGRPQKMAEHLEMAIEYNPDFAIGYLYLANYYLKTEDLERAEELAKSGLALSPEPSMAPLGHFVLADVYNRLGRFADAQRELETARRLQGS